MGLLHVIWEPENFISTVIKAKAESTPCPSTTDIAYYK